MSYQDVALVGLSTPEIIRLAYGRLLRALHALAQHDQDPVARGAALGQAHDLIGALIEATKAAPEDPEPAAMAERLRSLYGYWGARLATMALRTDHTQLEAIMTQVRELAEAWDTMLRTQAEPAVT